MRKNRLKYLEALYKRMPRCCYKSCRKKATRKTIANGVLCDEHAKTWCTSALPWAAAIRRLG